MCFKFTYITMAIILFILPLLFVSQAHVQYSRGIPCHSDEQCASVLGLDSSTSTYTCFMNYCLCASKITGIFRECPVKEMRLATKATKLRRNCTFHDDCSDVEGALCLPKDPKDRTSKFCLCQLNMVESEDEQSCLPAVTEIGGQCLEQVQCISRLGEGAECIDGHCRCQSTYHFKNSKCVRNLGYGDNCNIEEDACYETSTADGINVLTCTENYGCKCKERWIYSRTSQRCEFSSASQIAVQFVVMSVLILFTTVF